jgi:predicted chitinase
MEKKLFISLLGTLLLLAYPNDCSPENIGLWTTEIILQTLDTGDLSEEQMALMREELEIYQEALEPLMKTDMEAWKKKIGELLRKLAQGFKIYNLVHKNPDLKIKVDSFTRQTNIEVYIFPYVEDAFLNNIFQRLAEARYDIFKRAHLKMRYKFKKASSDSSNKFTVKLQLVYDSALVVLLKNKLASGYKDYSDLTLEASANKGLQKAGIQDIFSDAASTNTGVDPTAEDILDKLASANVEAVDEEPDYLSVMICDSIVKNGKIYYWTKGCLLKVKMDNKDPENVKEINLGLTINISNPKSVKTYSYVIKDFINWNTLKVDSLPEGKYTLVATINKKLQSKTFYLRKTKPDYACVKCGRDLTITVDILKTMAWDKKNPFTALDAALLTKLLKKAGFNNCKSQAHFFSQSCHESLGFSKFAEMAGFSMKAFYDNAPFQANCNAKLLYSQDFWDNKKYKEYFPFGTLSETSTNSKASPKYLGSDLTKYKWGSKQRQKADFSSCLTPAATSTEQDYIEYPITMKPATIIPPGEQFYVNYTLSDDEIENCKKKMYSLLYATFLGNGSAETEDGYNYRGRGMVHLTGKDNYQKVSEKCNSFFNTAYDFKTNYEKLTTDKEYIIYSAIAFYLNTSGLIKAANDGTCLAVSKLVNCGNCTTPNGYSDATTKYTRLKLFLYYKNEIYYDCNITETQ